MMKIEKSLLSGSTPLLVLSLLKDGDKYGYQMADELAKRSDDTFELKEGTLYPLLHQLEQKGYLTSFEQAAGEARIRKYYHLTDKGRKQLQERQSAWEAFTNAVSAVMGGAQVVAH